MACSIEIAWGPEMRTTATAPCPGAVAGATMVSASYIRARLPLAFARWRSGDTGSISDGTAGVQAKRRQTLWSLTRRCATLPRFVEGGRAECTSADYGCRASRAMVPSIVFRGLPARGYEY